MYKRTLAIFWVFLRMDQDVYIYIYIYLSIYLSIYIPYKSPCIPSETKTKLIFIESMAGVWLFGIRSCQTREHWTGSRAKTRSHVLHLRSCKGNYVGATLLRHRHWTQLGFFTTTSIILVLPKLSINRTLCTCLMRCSVYIYIFTPYCMELQVMENNGEVTGWVSNP